MAARVRTYLRVGVLINADAATVAVDSVPISLGATTAAGSRVTVTYPFQFIVLQPVARLLVSGSTVGSAVTLTASSEMRNEAQ